MREKSVREHNRRRQEGAKRTTESSTLDSQHPVRLIDRARWTTTLPGGRAADGEGERWKLLPRKGTREGVYDRGKGKIFPSLFSPFAASLFLSLSFSFLFAPVYLSTFLSLSLFLSVCLSLSSFSVYSIPPLFLSFVPLSLPLFNFTLSLLLVRSSLFPMQSRIRKRRRRMVTAKGERSNIKSRERERERESDMLKGTRKYE